MYVLMAQEEEPLTLARRIARERLDKRASRAYLLVRLYTPYGFGDDDIPIIEGSGN